MKWKAGAVVAALAFAAGTASADTPRRHTDAEVIAILNAVDQHEIDLASWIVKQSPSKPVLDYAKLMEREHNENMEKNEALAKQLNLTGAMPPEVTELKQHGDSAADHLKEMKGGALEREYIDDMVKGHQDVLTLIDTKLMTSELKPEVKKHLSDTRAHVAEHLSKAKALQTTLASTGN